MRIVYTRWRPDTAVLVTTREPKARLRCPLGADQHYYDINSILLMYVILHQNRTPPKLELLLIIVQHISIFSDLMEQIPHISRDHGIQMKAIEISFILIPKAILFCTSFFNSSSVFYHKPDRQLRDQRI